MKSRLNWRPEEDKLLKQLRDTQKLTSWHDIASKLSIQFSYSNRSAKQCRERYSNTARFCNGLEENKAWTEEDDLLLYSLYLENGSKWTLFLKDFPSKSENSIKNRFHSCLRRFIRKMRDYQDKSVNIDKKCQMIVTMLEIANRIQLESQSLIGKKMSQNSNLFKLRKNILQMTFKCSQISDDQIKQVRQQIRKVNSHYRCLGIFKAKNKGKWELNKKRLLYIMSLDENEIADSVQPSSEQNLSDSTKNQLKETVAFSHTIQDQFPIQDLEENNYQFWRSNTKSFDDEMCLILGQQFQSELFSFHSL